MASFAASTAACGVGGERGPPAAVRHPPRLAKDRSSSTESAHSADDRKHKHNLDRRRDHHSPKKDIGHIDEQVALEESLDEAGNRIVTMTGTITRGKRHSQAVEVKLALTEHELRRFSTVQTQSGEPGPECLWGARQGLHVFLLSLLYMPAALLSSLLMTFYLGTLTWYNIYLYLSEECTIWHKILLCPMLILLYPLLIVVISLLISAYATLIQLSWFYQSWIREIKDFDKGFFSWLCNSLRLSQCAPYQVVILDEKLSQNYVCSDSGQDVRKHVQTSV